MKTRLFTLCISCVLLVMAASANAQFVLSTALDSVQVYTQWGREKPAKKDSPKVLVVRIENSNPQPVQVSFDINFIDDLKVVETSGVQKLTIAAGKAGKPKRMKMKFKPASYNPEDMDGVDIQMDEVLFFGKPNF